MQQTDPRKVRAVYCGRVRGHPAWENNPRFAHPKEEGDFQILVARDQHDLRPYHVKKTPERWYFNEKFRPDVGEIYLSEKEKRFGSRYTDRIILEPHLKPQASPNKQWSWVNWNKLAFLMQRAGLRVTQIGPPGTKLLDGAELVVTQDLRQASAVMSRARAAVLPEGGLHHTAAVFDVPAVVIFGGLTPVEMTGYPMHVNIGTSFGGECGMRIPCDHCKKWMQSIKPESVFNELEKILGRVSVGGRRPHAEDGSASRGHDDSQRQEDEVRRRQSDVSIS